jgi:hypothetical protein
MKKIILLTIALICSSVFAANEIQQRADTGQTDLYCIIMDNFDLEVWDDENDSFKASPTWTDCDIALTEHALIKGLYTASFPSSIAGTYSIYVYKRAGATPANTDTYIAGWPMEWAGSNEATGYLTYSYAMTGSGNTLLIKAKTDLLNFTGTGVNAKVNTQVTAFTDVAFTALQIAGIRDAILGGDKTPITMVSGKAKAITGAVNN